MTPRSLRRIRPLLGVGAVTLAVGLSGLAVAPAEAQAAADHIKVSKDFSSGKPRNARITIPAVGIRRLPVIAYRGKTDDAPGTRIQNRGIAAAPYGPNGGTGPGGKGNYQVTAHRTAHGGVFRRTPSLDNGARILVDVGKYRYVYRVTRTRWVSFRSAKSLRQQRAAVPGHPGREPKRAFITVSTCATPEDHARGNYWTDRFGNPEHRIDKIGVMVRRTANPSYEPKG
ncbi:sortase domain-containing protein [Nocardioides mangrovi]|uniref:Sortase n=1 Tax=Nocardioides mangrovi TaxID=2874580 RepID=A0ABS7UE44_9ACTN|nr:sortase [Nocardioides mangrovi]MBZ5738912.1 sortase [Nocardioides mangrovi]